MSTNVLTFPPSRKTQLLGPSASH